MTSVGPDGASYSLANASLLLSWTSEAGVQSQTLPLTNAAGVQSAVLPAGVFTATLLGGTDAQVGYTLNRIADGGPTTVPAALLDPQPYTFTIAPGTTTNLALHFSVASVGAVTFSAGALAASLSTEAGTYPVSQGKLAGPLAFTSSAITGTPGASVAGLVALDDGGTTEPIYWITFLLTSPFAMQVNRACANIWTNVADPTAGLDPSVVNLSNLLNDTLVEQAGTLCFYDADDPTYPGQFVLQATTVHAPFYTAGAFGSNPGTATFSFSLAGTPATPIFSNGVLSLGLTNQPMALKPLAFSSSVTVADGGVAKASGTTGSVTLQMLP
jgi:hypothetical protein